MVEAKRLESEKQTQNGSDYKRNTWWKGRLTKVSEIIRSIAKMELGET